MNWEQVRSLVKNGQIVGSHTMTHPNMAYVSESEAQRELECSKQRLETELGQTVTHFSYPCPAMSPHWTPRTVEQSRRCGYLTAVTTNFGVVRRSDDPLSLRRVLPSKTVDGLRRGDVRIFGIRTGTCPPETILRSDSTIDFSTCRPRSVLCHLPQRQDQDGRPRAGYT